MRKTAAESALVTLLTLAGTDRRKKNHHRTGTRLRNVAKGQIVVAGFFFCIETPINYTAIGQLGGLSCVTLQKDAYAVAFAC